MTNMILLLEFGFWIKISHVGGLEDRASSD